jgi:Tfp pilus assembly protein PilF
MDSARTCTGARGQTNESLVSFDRALSIDPAFAPALEGASEATCRHNDSRASEYLQRLLSVVPANVTANAMAAVLAYHPMTVPRR